MATTETEYDLRDHHTWAMMLAADLGALREEIAEMKTAFAEYQAAQATEVRTQHLTIVRPDGSPILETTHNDSNSTIAIRWPNDDGHPTGIEIVVVHGESDGEWGTQTSAFLSLIARGDLAGGLAVDSEGRQRYDGTMEYLAKARLDLERTEGQSNRVDQSHRMVIEPTGIVRELPGRDVEGVVDFRLT